MPYRRRVALGLEQVLVGCWTDDEAETGVTVVLPPAGALGAVAVRGGAPGTREAAALGATGAGVECHAVALCGNSVFGLAAADGVVRWCVEAGRGLDIRGVTVPVVGAAVVYDVKDATSTRPTAAAGVAACEAATAAEPPSGPVGVGRGCTLGKSAGREYRVAGGQGSAVRELPVADSDVPLVVGALMAVNSVGDVLAADGSVLAGSTAPPDAPRYPYAPISAIEGFAGTEGRTNTTIGCVVTNAALTKPQAVRAADLAHTGIARAVHPPHTDFDGDAIFLLATGAVATSADAVATLAGEAIETAIRDAVAHAAGPPGTSPSAAADQPAH